MFSEIVLQVLEDIDNGKFEGSVVTRAYPNFDAYVQLVESGHIQIGATGPELTDFGREVLEKLVSKS